MKLVAIKDAKWTGKVVCDSRTGVAVRIDGLNPWARPCDWEITGRELDSAGRVTRRRWYFFNKVKDELPFNWLSVQP